MKKIFVVILMLLCSSLFAMEEQVVITYVESGLKNSNEYQLTGVTNATTMKGVKVSNSTIGGGIQDDSLDSIADFGWNVSSDFGGTNGTFTYSGGADKKYVIMPVVKNVSQSTLQEGNFSMSEITTNTETGEEIRNIHIDKTFYLPIKGIDIVEDSSYLEGNRFVYQEDNSVVVKHLEAFKKQEYIVRITKGSTPSKYDVYSKQNPVQIVNNTTGSNSEFVIEFLEGRKNYIDFRFNGDNLDKVTRVTTNYGLGMSFIPGKLELFGLPKGQYTLEVYSFRYSTEYSNRGSLVITLEDTVNFEGKGIKENEGISLLNFYPGEAPGLIDATLITVSSSSNTAISVKEEVDTDTKVNVKNLSVAQEELTTVYTSSGSITLDATGFDVNTNKYYKKWRVKYESNIIDKLEKERKVFYILNGDLANTATADYIVDYQMPTNLEYPHQTVIAVFNPSKNWEPNKYEIIDRVMPKKTFAYKQIKMVRTLSMEKFFRGEFENEFTLTQDYKDYYWDDAIRKESNAVVFKKPISDSKGTLATIDTNGGLSNSIFTFYTTKSVYDLDYQEGTQTGEPGDKATFSWKNNLKNSHGAVISEDKVIFRIVRLVENVDGTVEKATETTDLSVNGIDLKFEIPKYYYKHYEATNIIGSGNELTNINSFVDGTNKYVDLVFESGMDREVEGGNAVFTYSKEGTFQVIGLPRGSYLVQIYSLQDADINSKSDNSYDYRVLTYGGFTEFKMGLPTVVTGDFANKNNLFMIDSINVNSDFDLANNKPIKKVVVNFVTKAEQSLNLQLENLIARLDEEGGAKASTNRVTEQREGQPDILPVTNLTLSKSDKADFQFPLDVVFLIDNSGSMQSEINAVKAGLNNMTKDLESRGFDVKYNLITFGPKQNDDSIGSVWDNKVKKYDDNYMAMYKYQSSNPWFDSVTELEGAFGDIVARSGYNESEENGAWAIKYSKDHLVSNGRFLDFNNNIVANASKKEGYIPSAKWIVLLTDENMDIDRLPSGYTGANVIKSLAKELTDNSIKLTGIIHTRTYVYSEAEKDEYLKRFPTADVTMNNSYYTVKFADRIGNKGVKPADTGDKFYTEFLLQQQIGAEAFRFYEMGNKGQFVGAALADAVGNIGIVQRWIMTYDSPFPESDGFERQVIYSLKEIPKAGVPSGGATPAPGAGPTLDIEPFIRTGQKDRYYRVPESKIEAYFLNPNPQTLEIIAKDNKVILKTRVKSQYKDENGHIENYSVDNASFTVMGLSNKTYVYPDVEPKKTFKRSEVVENGVRWFEFTKEINKEYFETTFGKDGLTVEFTASTAQNVSVKIYVTSLKLVEKDAPKIKSITLTNNTLKGILEDLTSYSDVSGSSSFDTNFITSNSSITIEATSDGSIDMTGIDKLNVKAKDKIGVSIVVVEESGIDTSGTAISLAGLNLENINVEGTGPEKTITGTVTLVDSINDKNLEMDIVDTGGNKNDNPVVANEVLVVPGTQAGTWFKLRTGEGVTPENNMYYTGADDRATLTVENDYTRETDGSFLLYLFVFNHNRDESDRTDSTTYSPIPLGGSERLIPSVDTSFVLMDGKYTYPAVYVMNKAGAIREIGEYETLADLSGKAIIAKKSKKDFWVDTVAPVVDSANIIKTREGNAGTITALDNAGLGTIIDENYFKDRDTVKYSAVVDEFNLFAGSIVEVRGTGETTVESTVTSGGISYVKKIANPSELKVNGVELAVEDSDPNKRMNFIKGDESVDKNPISNETVLGIVKERYVARGDLSNLNNYQNSGTTFSSSLVDGKTTITFASFTSAGSIKTSSEEVVVDRNINDTNDKFYYETSYSNSGSYEVEIDFGKIKELSGLEKFEIFDSTVTVVPNKTLAIANDKSKTTVGTFIYSPNPKFKFNHNTMANKEIGAKVTDKLGNTKNIDIIIRINPNTKVIGKSRSGTKQESSVVEFGVDNINIKNKSQN